MAINLPHELAWVLQMLDFEWPEIDEDELGRGAQMVRQYGEDMSTCIDRIDAIVHGQIEPAYQASAGNSFVTSWDDTRSGNLKGYIELLDPAATGMDVFAAAVVGLKIKVIAELVITAAQIAAAIATAAFTFGASLAAQTAILIARKAALKFATNVVIEQVTIKVMEAIAEPMMGLAMQYAEDLLAAPVVSGVVAEVEQVQVDLAALDQASTDFDTAETDSQTLTTNFVTQFMSLQISTAG